MKKSNRLHPTSSVKISTKLSTLFSILILLSFSSCTVEDICTMDCYIIEGFVYDESTGEGLEGATVYLWYNDPGWFFSTDAIVTTKTDESGFYSLPYTGANYIDGTGELAIVVEKEDYFSIPEMPSAYWVEVIEIRADPPVERDFELTPSAEINYNIMLNISPLDNIEYVKCIANWGSDSARVNTNNPVNDTILVDKVAADRPLDITCTYKKRDYVKEETETLMIPKGERRSIDFEVR